jgi:hypothetical protein
METKGFALGAGRALRTSVVAGAAMLIVAFVWLLAARPADAFLIWEINDPPNGTNLTTYWDSEFGAPVDTGIFQEFCEGCDEDQQPDPEFEGDQLTWPGVETFLWSNQARGLEGVGSGQVSSEYPYAPLHTLSWNCANLPGGWDCRSLTSWTSTGSPLDDRLFIDPYDDGPPINVSISTGDGDDTVDIGGGFGSRQLDGGPHSTPTNPTCVDGDELRITPSKGNYATGAHKQIRWNVDVGSGTASPKQANSADASPIGFSGFEHANATTRDDPFGPGHTLEGSNFRNCLFGGSGDDTIDGDGGNDVLNGNMGSDDVGGGAGDDEVRSFSFEVTPEIDTLAGGDGHDKLYAGGGDDTLTGGSGIDRFDCGPGTDLVTDNVPGEVLVNCETFTGYPQCSDGFDNDEDDETDYPDDPECESADDDSEAPDPESMTVELTGPKKVKKGKQAKLKATLGPWPQVGDHDVYFSKLGPDGFSYLATASSDDGAAILKTKVRRKTSFRAGTLPGGGYLGGVSETLTVKVK